MSIEIIKEAINSFISNLFSVSAIVFLIAVVFRKVIEEKIRELSIKTIEVNGMVITLNSVSKIVKKKQNEVKNNCLEENKKQPAFKLGIKDIARAGNFESENILEGGEKYSDREPQPDMSKWEDPKNSDNPIIAIPCIYADIETAVKDKFDISDSSNMFATLLSEHKISNDTFVILESMKTLRDNIHFSVQTQKITEQNIEDYKKNAEGIIEIIEAIEE